MAGAERLFAVTRDWSITIASECCARNTVILIEHHLDVIRQADWIIDLGPEGGSAGGEVLFEGPPQELRTCERSITASFI